MKIYSPRMQRTDDRAAGNDPVRQRSTAMRAAVLDGEEALAEVEDGDLATVDLDCAPLTERNVFGMGNANPGLRMFHWVTISIG
ncbi:MAG TPA: hypothetical protein VJS11_07275 [Acidobacteriaceae bacterium]|nr:hypothetical protein [Acidobacteriaceae bacterium]